VRHTQLTLLLIFMLFGSGPIHAQTSAAAEFTFQVSPTVPWTDTGLDLQSDDILEISTTSEPECGPRGGSQAVASELLVPKAPEGALVARLHAHGSAPVLIGESRQLHIEEPAHLFLGMNISGSGSCQRGLTVKVHKNHAAASASTGSSDSEKSRGDQLKSQLSTAADIFLQGQFGSGTSDSSNGSGASSPAVILKLSEAPLDADLRRGIDGLPRRVNDQFQNLGDMVNFVLVGSQKEVQAALDAANWHVADTSNENAALNAFLETYQKKDYLAMPMSTLYLFGRRQDFGYEQAEAIAMVASRHHFRIWKAPFTWKGREVWAGAGTHDIGFAKDKRNGNVTHKIDPVVDGERDNIGNSLQKANKTKSLTYYLPPNAVQNARNATGDGYSSDGRLLIIVVQ
jgi:hypothetical protein